MRSRQRHRLYRDAQNDYWEARARRARRILLRRTTEQLIFSKLQATAGQDDHAWKRRTLALRSGPETCPG